MKLIMVGISPFKNLSSPFSQMVTSEMIKANIMTDCLINYLILLQQISLDFSEGVLYILNHGGVAVQRC